MQKEGGFGWRDMSCWFFEFGLLFLFFFFLASALPSACHLSHHYLLATSCCDMTDIYCHGIPLSLSPPSLFSFGIFESIEDTSYYVSITTQYELIQEKEGPYRSPPEQQQPKYIASIRKTRSLLFLVWRM